MSHPAPFLPGSLYAQSVGTTWKLNAHSAVIGIEETVDVDYLGLVGLPRLHAVIGAARVIRGPLQNKGSAYLAIGWRP